MSTETLKVQHTAGKNVYASVWDATGQVLDHADNTFKALASATTPGIALTERTNEGGVGKSAYTGSLDLAAVNKGPTATGYSLSFYERAGGSPAPLTDAVLTYPYVFTVQCAEIGDFPISVEFMPCFTTTAGTTVRIAAKILRAGKIVPVATLDPTATLALAVREFGAGADLFTVAATTVGADHVFEMTQASPGYTADRLYKYTATLVQNGVTLTSFDKTFIPILG